MDGYELVLQFRGREVETEDEIVEIEDALCELLADGESCDGHEVLPGARNIFVTTGDAKAAFARIAPFLAGAGLIDHVVVASRPQACETFTTLWPQHRDQAFART